LDYRVNPVFPDHKHQQWLSFSNSSLKYQLFDPNLI
jgi:hypothetical protein